MIIVNLQFIANVNFGKGVVMFSQSTYEINESDDLLQAVLVLSALLASNTVLQIEASSITATGTYLL